MRRANDIATVYNLYVNDLFTYGVYLGFQKEVVKDAIHDVFTNLTARNSNLSGINNIKFYLFGALKNRLYDIHKSTKLHVGLDDIIPEISPEIPDIPFNISVNLENLIIEKEEKERLKKEIDMMLDSLTDRQREIIYLRYVQEYDYEEISKLLKISIHGCRKLVSKAIISLREKYGSQ